jgi:hypothetical protein
MNTSKLVDLSVEDRTEYISDMCVLAQHIQDLTLKLQIKISTVKQYMEEEGVDKIFTECGTILYMAYDKDLLNKDKTLLIKINDMQKDENIL